MNATAARREIEEIVNRETRAWDTRDVALLLSIFHPDFVWPWPPSPNAHDPAQWVLRQGRFNADRWSERYRRLFAEHELVHNRRGIVKIEISQELDGAFAVVDIDTLWRSLESREEMHWLGRTCKVYARVQDEWKLTMHTGVLDYGSLN